LPPAVVDKGTKEQEFIESHSKNLQSRRRKTKPKVSCQVHPSRGISEESKMEEKIPQRLESNAVSTHLSSISYQEDPKNKTLTVPGNPSGGPDDGIFPSVDEFIPTSPLHSSNVNRPVFAGSKVEIPTVEPRVAFIPRGRRTYSPDMIPSPGIQRGTNGLDVPLSNEWMASPPDLKLP
jgi:hypothetical protein